MDFYRIDEKYIKFLQQYEKQKRGITNSVATCTLMIELGQSVHFSSGNETNIKLTTQGDMRLFKALLSLEEKE